jgi:hypothetical protein
VLASLSLAQIQPECDIWFFDVETAKNSNSQRRVSPLRAVIESGFLTYAEGLRERGATQVFPELNPGANGYGKNVTRRFAAYLDERKIVDRRKVFHIPVFRPTTVASVLTKPMLLASSEPSPRRLFRWSVHRARPWRLAVPAPPSPPTGRSQSDHESCG